MSRYQPSFVPVSDCWLRKRDGKVQVLLKVKGEWRLVISESEDGPISHFVSAGAVSYRPIEKNNWPADLQGSNPIDPALSEKVG